MPLGRGCFFHLGPLSPVGEGGMGWPNEGRRDNTTRGASSGSRRWGEEGRRGNRRGTKVPWENGMEGRSFVRGERERANSARKGGRQPLSMRRRRRKKKRGEMGGRKTRRRRNSGGRKGKAWRPFPSSYSYVFFPPLCVSVRRTSGPAF